MSKQKISKKSAYNMIVTAAIMWGLCPLVYKQGLAVTSIVIFLAGRFLFGGIAIYIFEKKNFIKLPKRVHILLVLFGLLDGIVANYIFATGVQKTSVIHTALIALFMPFLVYYFANLLLKERIHRTVIVGALVAAIGLGIIIISSNTSSANNSLLGDAIIMVYTTVNALLIVIGRYLLSKKKYKTPPEQLAYVEYMASGMVLAVLSIASFRYINIDFALQSVWLMVFAGTITGAIPIVLYFRAAKVLPAERLADTFFITPFVAMLSGIFVLGEQVTTALIVGTSVLLFGLLISNNKIHPVLIAHQIHAEEKFVILLFRKPKKAFAYVTNRINR